MHTRMNIAAWGISGSAFNDVSNDIRSETERIENLISRHIPGSDVFRINNRSSNTLTGIHPEVYGLLSACMEYNEKTSGCFDITANKDTPARSAGKSFRLDPAGSSIHFYEGTAAIDLGGIGKGYALEAIRAILKNHSVGNALVSFGDSSILALGRHPYGDCWKIGIMNHARDTVIHEWEMRDTAVSTSRSVNGHIVDPRTGKAVFSERAATVMCSNAAEAEVISTALVVAADSEINLLRSNFSGANCVIFEKENKVV